MMVAKSSFFHSCGTVVILKYDPFLEIVRPYCPKCEEFFDFQDFPHLEKQRKVILHSNSEKTLILDHPPIILNDDRICNHSDRTLLQYHEGHKMYVYRCNLCNRIIRDRN